jgi:pimeloyl-ACP methyl ester carboxylesterase
MITSYRKYGTLPIQVVILHGGPGAIGEMTPVAKKLASFCAVLEPFQTKLSLQEELLFLKDLLKKEAKPPVILIGHSFGAWVALLFSAQFPELVKKLILVGCPPFEDKYLPSLMEKRSSRMTRDDVKELEDLKKKLADSIIPDKSRTFARVGEFFRRVDSFDPIVSKDDTLTSDFKVYETIWKEGKEMRSSGALLQELQKIRCPVTIIHGEVDPHPIDGVLNPLQQLHLRFKKIMLQECGHTPWIERNAKDKFFDVLREEIKN